MFVFMVRDWLIDPLKDAIGLRIRYFAASRLRWLALGFLIATLITMLAIPEINLTGTRWAVFLPVLAAYLTARLSAGVALFEHARRFHHPDDMGFGLGTDNGSSGDGNGLDFTAV